MKIKDFVAGQTVRGWIYKLMADCYQRPGVETVETINTLNDILNTICPMAASYSALAKLALEDEPGIDRLRVDYARLFVGPFAITAPPYGSVYLESKPRLMGDSTLDALQRYREAGVSIAGDFKDAPDHIAVELEFMSFLIFKSIEASGNSDPGQTAGFFETQKSFVEDHLGAWVFKFADAVVKNAATAFYRNLARATAAFLEADGSAISEALEAEPFAPEKLVEINSLWV